MSGLLLASVVVALVGGLAATGARSDHRARATARVAAAAAGALAVSALVLSESGGGTRDNAHALPLVLAAFVPFAMLVGAPRAELPTRVAAALVLLQGAALLCIGAQEVLGAAMGRVLFFVAAIPGLGAGLTDEERRRVRLAHGVYIGLGAVPTLVGFALLARAATHYDAPELLRLDGTSAAGIAGAYRPVLFACFGATALTRLANLPFHSWLPTLFESGPVGATVTLLSGLLGMDVMARFAMPFAPVGDDLFLSAFAAAGIVTAVYGAIGAIGQRELRRSLSFVLLSQLGLLGVGLASRNLVGSSGALLYGSATTLAFLGLALATFALEARIGRVQLHTMSGAVGGAPRLAALHVLITLAAAGLPGSLGFIGEDLITQALVDAHPVVATFVLVATALNGFVLLRGVFLAYFGPAQGALPPSDLLPRERHTLLAIFAVIVVFGLFPGALLALQPETQTELTPPTAMPPTTDGPTTTLVQHP